MAHGSCEWCGNAKEACECEDALHRMPRVYPRQDRSFGTRILPADELIPTEAEVHDEIQRIVKR